jgi:hypothetical protein
MTVLIDLRAFALVDRNVLMKTMIEKRIREGLVIRIEQIIRETKNKARIRAQIGEEL